MHRAQTASIRHGVQAQNFARLAFSGDLERPAAHLAIRRESLERYARINYQLKPLAAERTLDILRNLHPAI